ncbi:hypothetical protein CHS0354_025488 [Potamilus streckersoni]|uniref:Zer-1-like leucine-rich repeats region domain-containing protein n=1 Tax=Potamilus streckersoni TaxID=2493646 RepID=A0AAE0RRT7_9BIVA|nr:hypothetical protein CHS0354_025488 [Potamilus streckersoni]
MHSRKEYDMPMSLQECCLHYICENLDELCQEINPPHSSNLKLVFRNSDVFFNEALAEAFLKTLSDQGRLNDLALSLFDSHFMHLKSVWIKDAQLSPFGLKILKTQKISELEITGLRNVTVNDVLGSLGTWTLRNLKTLHMSKLKSLRDGVPNCLNTTDVAVNISCLRRLKCLNVSNTQLNLNGLEIIAEELPCLEILDISDTSIHDISPLRKCKDRLKYLSLYQLKIYTDIVPVLSELSELVYLDVSYDWNSNIETRINFDRFKFKVSNLLRRTQCLPNLSSLDISGNEGLDQPLLM